ncbi:MAG: hypothetical protein OQK57_00475 [Ignavibacteriaceae bacterium]|nr:hypothetical protein [Ignavibacteriaceae bacterium]
MKSQIIIVALFIIFISACNPEDLISEFGDSVITAKSKVGETLNTAKSNFAQDAKLAAIYGLNVNTKGQIDLLKPTENNFVYVVQSDSTQSNELYIPVYKNTPVKSPINFTDMLSLIKDDGAKDILGEVFNNLSALHIEGSVSYDDSPEVIDKMIVRSDVSTFRAANLGSKIDMFLVPSKSIDTTSITSTADWIVNFYGDTSSLVLWLHPGTVNGTVDVLSN